MTATTLTARELRRAADLKERIEALQSELDELLGNGQAQTAAAPMARRGRKRHMSAAGRARIAAAAKARWAAYRLDKGQPREVKRKRRLSPAGRAAIAAAAKARWARAKAAGKSKL